MQEADNVQSVRAWKWKAGELQVCTFVPLGEDPEPSCHRRLQRRLLFETVYDGGVHAGPLDKLISP